MKRYLLFVPIACAAALACAAQPCRGAETELVLTVQDLQDEPEAPVRLTFILSNADVVVDADADADTAVRARIRHDTEADLPKLAFEREDNGIARAVFSSGSDTGRQHWHISMGRHMPPILLTIEGHDIIGSGLLGGLPLRTCTLFLNATDLQVEFDRKAPLPLEIFMITGADFDLSVVGLGNSDVETTGLLCRRAGIVFGAGDTFPGPGRIRQFTLFVAGSDITVELPRDAGCLVSGRTLFSNFSATGDDWERQLNVPLLKRYKTTDFALQDTQLYIDLFSVGSTVRIER